MTHTEAKSLIAHSRNVGRRMSPHIERAVLAVLTGGLTWRAAARAHDVTESGILRAMKRLGVR